MNNSAPIDNIPKYSKKATGCMAHETIISNVVGSASIYSSKVTPAVASPLFHHSGMFCEIAPSPVYVIAIGCAGASHAIEPSVGIGCSVSEISTGNEIVLEYENVVTIDRVI